jgi:hypothetical protein
LEELIDEAIIGQQNYSGSDQRIHVFKRMQSTGQLRVELLLQQQHMQQQNLLQQQRHSNQLEVQVLLMQQQLSNLTAPPEFSTQFPPSLYASPFASASPSAISAPTQTNSNSNINTFGQFRM